MPKLPLNQFMFLRKKFQKSHSYEQPSSGASLAHHQVLRKAPTLGSDPDFSKQPASLAALNELPVLVIGPNQHQDSIFSMNPVVFNDSFALQVEPSEVEESK